MDLAAGDLAVFIGAGGLGSFGVQVAAALGAHTVAIDVSEGRLALVASYGASLTLRADELGFKEIRGAIKDLAKKHNIPTYRQKIFETSGTDAGQSTAFGLLGHGGYLSVVGFTLEEGGDPPLQPHGVRRHGRGSLGMPAGALPSHRRAGLGRQSGPGPLHRVPAALIHQ